MLQGQFSPQIGIELVVVSQQLINQGSLIPQPRAKELRGHVLVHGGLEAVCSRLVPR